MKYFFVLGTNTTLSVAELNSVLDLKTAQLLAPDFLILETNEEINPERLIKYLGGIIKIGIIKSETAEKDLLSKITELASNKKAESPEGKFNFGISSYGQKEFNKKDLGLKLKKHFKEQNISSRFVVSREKTLSSVVVTQNKLLRRGIEIILIKTDDKVLIGETVTVQPFKDLSKRDYGRPARDDLSGMLPPKLAQVMINLAQIKEDDLIVDPFCGSGTVLSEAMLGSYKNLVGSDSSLKAIENTRENIEWIRDSYQLESNKIKLLVKNVLDLSKFIKNDSVDAIITEPYLGPQRGRIDFKEVIDNLEQLYSQAFQEFSKVLKPKGRVVMIWPVFYGSKLINPDHNGFKIINPLPEHLVDNEFIKITKRNTFIYGRPKQKVYREIVVLERE